ncbi:TVP38/TMEM64 family protein [Chelativorans sp. AA-79]|uniref:TVP38/TMEM64 family protein n=1 Tax=Chelativorans sp. AA-79 TaxID=3028735 RepID=UPI0023F8802E|nr:TVP38/TMEM64 family protein [Chelativorans sp. AA-79]WEX09807.1 TVP38/TMEM64 family protein [Chelativorans sp. AA-79]
MLANRRRRGTAWKKVAVGIAIVLALAVLYWWLRRSGALEILGNEPALRAQIRRLGFWGPLAIVVMITGAIVLSPIPSGPIAMVAGAVYGPVLGTIYVVAGAEAGAIIAFWIARIFGYEIVRRWSRVEPLLDQLRNNRSQNWLMTIVFASRLVPFISFDAVSYAAGLTPLAFWRFAVATLLGVVPISFLLTYFGKQAVTADPMHMMIIAVVVGGVTLVPFALKLLWERYRNR